eukprot:gene8468-10049_t
MADADRLDSVANVSLILNKFRHLRQLLLGNSSGESKLSELSPLPLSTASVDKPAGKHSTRRKSAILPVHSAPGSMLEELFSNHVSAVSSAFSLPALRSNPHLRVLRITQSTHHSSGSIPPLSAAGLWTILQHCPLLRTIEYKKAPDALCATFRIYDRQLVTIPECEDCLQCLQTDPQEHDIDSQPVPGSRLEELYDYASIDYVSKTELPALRAVGCKNVNLLPVLPPHVKKFVLVRNITMQNDLMIPNLCGLEEIELSLYHSISNQTMRRVALQNPHLKVLYLEQVVYGQNDAVTISAEVGNFCPRILAIDLENEVTDRSFQCFLAAIPPTLQSLCLPNCTRFNWTTLLDILHQCSDLREVRVGSFGSFNHQAPLDLTGTGFSGMRTFRADFTNFSERTLTVLSKLMPNLTTAVFVTSHMSAFRPDDYRTIVKSILEKFVYLRQLVFVLPCEDKLRPITHYIINNDMAGDKPRPGGLLEELYVTHPAECLSIVPLPALRTLGFRIASTLLVLPPRLKRVVLHRHEWANDSAPSFLHLSGLEELDAMFSHELSNHMMHRLAVQNPHLNVLRLEQTQLGTQPAMSAEGLWIFLKHCPHLHTIVYTASRSARKTESYVLLLSCIAL